MGIENYANTVVIVSAQPIYSQMVLKTKTNLKQEVTSNLLIWIIYDYSY